VHEYLEGLTNITELWLGKNKITSMYLPPMPKLTRVAWQCNRLTAWDKAFFENCGAKLTHLYCGENALCDWADNGIDWTKAPNIVEMDLSHNEITKVDEAFGAALGATLKEFWINANQIDFDANDQAALKGLRQLHKLETLYMEHNRCWDANYQDGGPTYQRVLRQTCAAASRSFCQLDALCFDFEKQIEDDGYHETVYQYRDNTVKGIRKVVAEGETSKADAIMSDLGMADKQ